MGNSLRVALVHDWLTGMRGGEKCLEVFADLFPDAPIYTLLHVPGAVSAAIESHEIRTSWLQRVPGAQKRYRYFLPLMPRIIESMKVEPVDLVLGTSTCVAKSIIPPPGAKSLCYVNSPMRYLYDRYDDYFGPGRAGLATRLAIRAVRGPLQRWDVATASRVHSMAGNSTFIAERIRRVYGRECRIIHPPVDTARFVAARREPEDYYLIVAALVPYKNIEAAVEAFRLIDRRLVIAGSGPLEAKLRAAAPSNVAMLGWVEDQDLPRLVAGCRAFLMPNVEDFGIAPVEAMAAGRPVVALGEGGVRDTVLDLDRWREGRLASPFGPGTTLPRRLGPTGLFYDEPSPQALADAILRFEAEYDAFHPDAVSAWAQEFRTERYRQKIVDWIEDELGAWSVPAAA
jgi:glycosyltransferase involved in cell wall biosynthesis